MNDILYVPTGDTSEGLLKTRLALVQELVNAGWRLEGKVRLMDLGMIGGTRFNAHVLSRPMPVREEPE